MTEDWIAKANAAEKGREELATLNRHILFDALGKVGITSVKVEFDGYSDEGQIDSTLYFTEERETTPAIGNLMFVRQGPDGTHGSQPIALGDAMDEFLYDLLEKHYGGWQDNEGSYGAFTFDIPACTVDLDINLRFIDSHNYQHIF